MEQELLYKVAKGDISKDKYWEMMDHRIKAITKELYNAELNRLKSQRRKEDEMLLKNKKTGEAKNE